MLKKEARPMSLHHISLHFYDISKDKTRKRKKLEARDGLWALVINAQEGIFWDDGG